jgi:hypothetical protein
LLIESLRKYTRSLNWTVRRLGNELRSTRGGGRAGTHGAAEPCLRAERDRYTTNPGLGSRPVLFALDATLIDLSPALFSAQPPYRDSNRVCCFWNAGQDAPVIPHGYLLTRFLSPSTRPEGKQQIVPVWSIVGQYSLNLPALASRPSLTCFAGLHRDECVSSRRVAGRHRVGELRGALRRFDPNVGLFAVARVAFPEWVLGAH